MSKFVVVAGGIDDLRPTVPTVPTYFKDIPAAPMTVSVYHLWTPEEADYLCEKLFADPVRTVLKVAVAHTTRHVRPRVLERGMVSCSQAQLGRATKRWPKCSLQVLKYLAELPQLTVSSELRHLHTIQSPRLLQ